MQPATPATGIYYSSFTIRVLAKLIDTVVSMTAIWLIMSGLQALFPETLHTVTSIEVSGVPMLFFYGFESFFGYVNLLLLILLPGLYGIVFTASPWQGTVGKKLCNLKVIGEQAQRTTFRQSVIRCGMQYVSFLPFLYGFWQAAFNHKCITWHDRVAKTLVARDVS